MGQDSDNIENSLVAAGKEDVWQFPELDPFGLVFGVAGDIPRRHSEFAKKIETFTKATFLNSTDDGKGRVVGKWKSYTGKTVITIQFAREVSYRPVSVETSFVESGDIPPELSGRLLGKTVVEWAPCGPKETYLPVKISIASEMMGANNGEISLELEWLNHELWSKQTIDFAGMATDSKAKLRSPFEELFLKQELAASKK